MSDELKKLYQVAGKLKYYFDERTPCDLYRGQSRKEKKEGRPILYPNPIKRHEAKLTTGDLSDEDAFYAMRIRHLFSRTLDTSSLVL